VNAVDNVTPAYASAVFRTLTCETLHGFISKVLFFVFLNILTVVVYVIKNGKNKARDVIKRSGILCTIVVLKTLRSTPFQSDFLQTSENLGQSNTICLFFSIFQKVRKMNLPAHFQIVADLIYVLQIKFGIWLLLCLLDGK